MCQVVNFYFYVGGIEMLGAVEAGTICQRDTFTRVNASRNGWFSCLLEHSSEKYAQTSRTIPFRTSHRISSNVSMIITSFPKNGKETTTTTPINFSYNHILTLFSYLKTYQSSINIGE
jgi:hypothetical protein